MRTKVFFLAVVAASVVPLTAHGQNLFRTGRPDYARTPTTVEPYSRYRNTPSYADQYAEAIGRTSGNVVQTDRDYQQLQAAWDAYRREAMRYQNRYRNAYSPAAFADPSGSVPSQPYGAGRCECRDRPRNRSFERGAPADYPPTLNSAPLRAESVNLTGYNYRYPDPARTASRPVADFFKSLLPAE